MVMISLPMANDPNWRERYLEVQAKLESWGYKVAPLTYKEMFGKRPPNFVNHLECQNTPLVDMAHSLYRMSLCDTVYFCSGWYDARGCRVEHWAAQLYGLKILYESDDRYTYD